VMDHNRPGSRIMRREAETRGVWEACRRRWSYPSCPSLPSNLSPGEGWHPTILVRAHHLPKAAVKVGGNHRQAICLGDAAGPDGHRNGVKELAGQREAAVDRRGRLFGVHAEPAPGHLEQELEGAGHQEIMHGVQIDPAPVVGHQHVVRHQAVPRLLDVTAEGKRRGGNAPAAVRPRPALPEVRAQALRDRRQVNPRLLEELSGLIEIAVGHRLEVTSRHGVRGCLCRSPTGESIAPAGARGSGTVLRRRGPPRAPQGPRIRACGAVSGC